MTIQEAYEQFTSQLETIYQKREANSIGRIVFEDEFKIYALNSKKIFDIENRTRLDEILTQLLKHEPIQYILGQADFYGHKFKVDFNVLIPRQETEELVYWVKNTIKEISKETLKILDIGTGSGCIPISLKKLFPEIKMFATDISPNALVVAKENANRLDVVIDFKKNNILKLSDQAQLGSYNIIISNPPYIPTKEMKLMPERVLIYEPGLALFVENDDPLLFYKAIADFGKTHLKENGFLFFEINEYNAQEVVNYLESIDYENVMLENDINGKPRMIRAKMSG